MMLAMLVLFSGCAALQPKNEYSASVRPGTHSDYIASFKWHPTYRLAETREEAVIMMLEKTNLIPRKCSKGIVYIRGGEAEGGWGWAEFQCS